MSNRSRRKGRAIRMHAHSAFAAAGHLKQGDPTMGSPKDGKSPKPETEVPPDEMQVLEPQKTAIEPFFEAEDGRSGLGEFFRMSEIMRMLVQCGLNAKDLQFMYEAPKARFELVAMIRSMRLQGFLAIHRHSVQRFLEKHQLSITDTRVAHLDGGITKTAECLIVWKPDSETVGPITVSVALKNPEAVGFWKRVSVTQVLPHGGALQSLEFLIPGDGSRVYVVRKGDPKNPPKYDTPIDIRT